MAAESLVLTGVVRGNTILLEGEVPLLEGAKVTVTLTKAVEPKSTEDLERQLYERLEAEGLISIPKTPPDQIRHNQPIKVKGKPLSQVIIEDRR